MNTAGYHHWKIQVDNENICWLLFDKENAAVNTINRDVLKELETILDDVAKDTSLKGLVIGSAKPSGFIAGADIDMIKGLQSVEEAKTLIQYGQTVFAKIAALSIPTVAMIEGFCLGGGSELALACRYRIADDGPKTRLGLPEVLLGIHPGWGGSVRLPKLIGAPQAMDLILSGRTIHSKAAAKIGFVDKAVPKRMLKRAVRSYVLETPSKHHPSLFQKLTNASLMRPLLAKFLRKKLNEKIRREHYPAPYAVIDYWQKYGVSNQAFEAEVNSLSKFSQEPSARNLIRVFGLQERMKALGKKVNFEPKHVHVIGAGVMGGDIAAWCALRGLTVTLQDREAKYIAPAIKRAYELFKKILKTPRDIQAVMDRLIPDPHADGVTHADVIIEAIFENLEAKQTLFKVLESRIKKDAVLATNTSSIPLDEIAQVLTDPSRLVGIHFFNPVSKMQLVEIVQGKKTSKDMIEKAIAFTRRIDRLPLPVMSSPGFLVNRVLMPYLMEAMQCVEEGIPLAAIDNAARSFGMPMGPIELADAVGLDICLAVAEKLAQYYGGTVPAYVREMVERKELGVKTGKGFYTYKNGKAHKEIIIDTSKISADLADRLIFRMLKESILCLNEKVVEDADLLDAGMIFGTGFAPFRGGPMHYMDEEGKENIAARFTALQEKYGDRFKIDQESRVH